MNDEVIMIPIAEIHVLNPRQRDQKKANDHQSEIVADKRAVNQILLNLLSNAIRFTDRGGKVIYIGSMSKLLSPSLRVGYIAAPVPVVDRAAAEITIIDRQGDPATETAVADLMESGAIKRHTRRVMRVYAERRELLGDLLLKAFGDLVSFTLPEGGLALWVQFNDGIDLAALADKAGAEGLRFLPGQSFAASAQPVQAVRLGFGSLDASELAEAVRRFARLVRGKNA